jgi:hypothetical protein
LVDIRREPEVQFYTGLDDISQVRLVVAPSVQKSSRIMASDDIDNSLPKIHNH